MGLYEQLAQSFPEEQTVFGLCLLVPSQIFKPEWESQLKAEGVKVFQNSYNGRMFFFLKKADRNSPEPILPRGSNQPEQSKAREVELKRFDWTSENLELVKRLRAEGLSFRAIERRLRELGFKIHHITIARKLKALEKAETEPKSLTLENVENPEDGLFRELMEASQTLYPRFKRACALLLREASRILES